MAGCSADKRLKVLIEARKENGGMNRRRREKHLPAKFSLLRSVWKCSTKEGCSYSVNVVVFSKRWPRKERGNGIPRLFAQSLPEGRETFLLWRNENPNDLKRGNKIKTSVADLFYATGKRPSCLACRPVKIFSAFFSLCV